MAMSAANITATPSEKMRSRLKRGDGRSAGGAVAGATEAASGKGSCAKTMLQAAPRMAGRAQRPVRREETMHDDNAGTGDTKRPPHHRGGLARERGLEPPTARFGAGCSAN